jgi:hypothetical protein
MTRCGGTGCGKPKLGDIGRMIRPQLTTYAPLHSRQQAARLHTAWLAICKNVCSGLNLAQVSVSTLS